jgi:hypothetical protein
MPPGSQKGLQMVVADVKAVRDELVKRGVAVSEIEVSLGGHLSLLAIPMAIAGPCSNSPVAPSFHAVAHSAASSVEDVSTAALADEGP